MDLSRRSTLIYGLLLAVWVLVLGWQVEEHIRIREAAKTELRGSARVIANFLSATIRGLRFRGAVVQDRLEPVLDLLVNGRTNELSRPSELIGITLLNSSGDPFNFFQLLGVGGGGRGGSGMSNGLAHLRWQMRRQDQFAAGEQDCAFHRIPEFPDVARPGISLQTSGNRF